MDLSARTIRVERQRTLADAVDKAARAELRSPLKVTPDQAEQLGTSQARLARMWHATRAEPHEDQFREPGNGC